MLQLVVFSAVEEINCGCLPADVKIEVRTGLTALDISPADFIDGKLLSSREVCASNNTTIYEYTLSYEDNQLGSYDSGTDIAVPLTSRQVKGFFCKDCLFRFTETIVQCPECPECELCFDPEALTLLEDLDLGDRSLKWLHGVLHSNGKIYAMPNIGSGSGSDLPSESALIITPASQSYEVADESIADAIGSGGPKLYRNSVALENGDIYACPNSGGSTRPIIKFNVTTEEVTTIDYSSLAGQLHSTVSPTSSSANFFSSVHLAPNGSLYFVPGPDSNNISVSYLGVLKLDPSDDSLSVIDISGMGSTATRRGWCGGAITDDGVIYAGQGFGTTLLKIDTTTDTVTLLGSFSISNDPGHQSTVIGSDGRVYFTPGTRGEVRILDPDTDANFAIGNGTILGTSRNIWGNGFLAPDGAVWVPLGGNDTGLYDDSRILRIYPNLNLDFDLVLSESSLDRYYHGVVGLDSKVYMIPSSANNVAVIG